MYKSDVTRNKMMIAAIEAATAQGFPVVEVWHSRSLKMQIKVTDSEGRTETCTLYADAANEDSVQVVFNEVGLWLTGLGDGD